MKRTLLKSKIHRATVTEADLSYEGSISIDPRLCEAADIVEYEKVEIYNCNAGTRFSTYVIFGKSNEICLNGAAARMVARGDLVIICTYCDYTEEERSQFKPKLVFVDELNNIKKISSGH